MTWLWWMSICSRNIGLRILDIFAGIDKKQNCDLHDAKVSNWCVFLGREQAIISKNFSFVQDGKIPSNGQESKDWTRYSKLLL